MSRFQGAMIGVDKLARHSAVRSWICVAVRAMARRTQMQGDASGVTPETAFLEGTNASLIELDSEYLSAHRTLEEHELRHRRRSPWLGRHAFHSLYCDTCCWLDSPLRSLLSQ